MSDNPANNKENQNRSQTEAKAPTKELADKKWLVKATCPLQQIAESRDQACNHTVHHDSSDVRSQRYPTASAARTRWQPLAHAFSRNPIWHVHGRICCFVLLGIHRQGDEHGREEAKEAPDLVEASP